MTSMREALGDARFTPADMPQQRGLDMPAVTLMTTWNHPCPTHGCVTWVPNHLTHCATHTTLEIP